MTRPTGLDTHPDILEMRAKYERASWSAGAQAIDGLTLLAGLYLAISPWVAGFFGLQRITVSNLVTGLFLAALGVGFASAYGRTYGLTWLAPVLGVWAIVSPWILRSATTSTLWNNIVTGAVILLLGVGAMTVGSRPAKMPMR